MTPADEGIAAAQAENTYRTLYRQYDELMSFHVSYAKFSSRSSNKARVKRIEALEKKMYQIRQSYPEFAEATW